MATYSGIHPNADMVDDDGKPQIAVWRCWYRFALWTFLTTSGLLLGVWGYHTFLGTNLHAVIPGELYRSAQLSPAQLAEVVQRLGIRTVINLRGCCEGFDWYEQERRTLQVLGVQLWDCLLYTSDAADE